MLIFWAAFDFFLFHETIPRSMGNCKTMSFSREKNTLALIAKRKQLMLKFQGEFGDQLGAGRKRQARRLFA